MFFRRFIAIFTLILLHATAWASDESVNFISLSDIHFNPYANCVSASPCPLIDTLQQAPVSQWEDILAQAQPSLGTYGKDTNYPLFKQSLAQVSKTVTDKTRFVVVLGDLIAHKYNNLFMQYSSVKTQAAYQAFVKKTLEFVIDELNQTLPQQNIFVALGNNDTYVGDYSYEPTHQLTQDMAPMFGRLIRDEHARATMQKEFTTDGYYALDVPGQPNLHLVVLNTVLFSINAVGDGVEQAAQTELKWLEQEFQQNPDKKFLIIMHIPPGIDVYYSLAQTPFKPMELWKPDFTRQFLAEVKQHSAQITGLMAGHFHMDFFQVLDTVPLVGVPAISPLFGNNPGFKVMSYSDQTLALQNFDSYFVDLASQGVWQLEYNFNAIYQPNCSQCQLLNGMNQMTETNPLANQYRHYFAMGQAAQPIAKDQNWQPYYWCAIHRVTAADYLNCISTQ